MLKKTVYDETLEKYFSKIGEGYYSPISFEEEIEIFKEIEKGSQKAKNKIIEANLRFVVKIALSYERYNLPLNDLISEGNMGLIKAIDKFDVNKGFKFISYAVWWIRQSIQEYINNHIEVTFNTIDLIEDITESDEDEFNFNEIIDSEYLYKENESDKKDIVNKLLSTLTKREELIVRSYYGIGDIRAMNLDEIGEVLSLTKERVRQIKKNAILKLKSAVLLLNEFHSIYNM